MTEYQQYGCLSPVGNFNHAVMEYGKQGECRKIDDSYSQQIKMYNPTYITSRLGFKLTIITNNMETFLKDNDLKAVWNKDGKVEIDNEILSSLPVLNF
jgi:hypothetical protein